MDPDQPSPRWGHVMTTGVDLDPEASNSILSTLPDPRQSPTKQEQRYKSNQDIALGLAMDGKRAPFTEVENPYQTGVRVAGNVLSSPVRGIAAVGETLDNFANADQKGRDAMQGDIAMLGFGWEGAGMLRQGMKGGVRDSSVVSSGGGKGPPPEYWAQMEQELSTRLNNINDRLARRNLSKQEIRDLTDAKQEINKNLLEVIRVRNSIPKKPAPTEPSKPQLRGKKTLLNDEGIPPTDKQEGPVIRPEATRKVKSPTSGEDVEVWTNPSRQAIKDMQEQGIKTFRFILGPDGDIDVWPAFDAVHEDIRPGVTRSNLIQGNVTYDPQTGRALYDVIHKNEHGMLENLKLSEAQLRKKVDTYNKPQDMTFEEEMKRALETDPVVDNPPAVEPPSNVIEGPFNKASANDNLKLDKDGLIVLSAEDQMIRDAWNERIASIKDDLNITRKQLEQIMKDKNPSIRDIKRLQGKEKALQLAQDDLEFNLRKQDQERDPNYLKFRDEQLTLREKQLTEYQQFDYDTAMDSVYPKETHGFKRKALLESGAEPQDIWQIIDASIGGNPRALKIKWDQVMKAAEEAPTDRKAQALARFFQDLVNMLAKGPQ